MKVLFFSDIHGCLTSLKKVEKIIQAQQACQIVLLGDLMYHGPRNPLPQGYDPAGVADFLNRYKNNIIAVRGNCDSEVDQMLLDFPIMADSSQLIVDGHKFFLTHGHLFSPNDLPSLSGRWVFVSGHTHIPVVEKENDVVMFNPGSLSLPKDNLDPSFGVYHKGKIEIRDLDCKILKELVLT